MINSITLFLNDLPASSKVIIGNTGPKISSVIRGESRGTFSMRVGSIKRDFASHLPP